MRLNLKANGENEQRVLDYLEKNASNVLQEKINNGEKTMAQCWSYIKSEARKRAKNGCACIDDMTVFGWAVHFFEEDDIEAKAHDTSDNEVKRPEAKPEKKKVAKKVDDIDQISFDDLFGG